MQIIIPMSGLGSRFIKKGYKNIKPLIEVDGKPIIEYVINMFPRENNFLFICNEDHLKETNLRDELTRIKPSGKIVGIKTQKKGPVWAVAQAMDHIGDNEPTIVNYCDFNCVWDYLNFKKEMKEKGYDGSIPCYIGFHPHLLGPNLYASCKVNEKNELMEIKEKYSWTEDKMKSYQSSGTYYFKSGAIVKKYFQQLIDKNINLNGEYYVSLVYNLLVQEGLKVNIFAIEKFCQWGTPEDLEEFVYWQEYFKAKKNETN
jgi:NDP-sugar pyrophosphorylase family protein